MDRKIKTIAFQGRKRQRSTVNVRGLYMNFYGNDKLSRNKDDQSAHCLGCVENNKD